MSEVKNLSVEDIQNIENVIGYTFKIKKLLVQAFTRSSYVNEHKGELSNEVLEFYGDRALDITVTTALSRMMGFIYKTGYITSNPFDSNYVIDEGFLSNLRSAIVCKKALAKRIDELDLVKYLRTGNGDLIENRFYTESVKEDLLEAICGAIAIELNWEFNDYSKIISNLIDLPSKIVEMIKGSDKAQILNEWHLKKFGVPVYVVFVEKYDEDEYGSSIIIDELGQHIQVDGYGSNGVEAKNNAMESAYDMLFAEGKRFEYYPEDILEVFKKGWLEPTKDNAINIVQEMEQAHILEKVSYEFQQEGNNKDGNPLWKGTVNYSFNEHSTGHITTGTKESKMEIKKRLAIALIRTVFEEYHYKKEVNID